VDRRRRPTLHAATTAKGVGRYWSLGANNPNIEERWIWHGEDRRVENVPSAGEK